MVLFALTYITIKTLSLLSHITYTSGKWMAKQMIEYYYDYNRLHYPILIDNVPHVEIEDIDESTIHIQYENDDENDEEHIIIPSAPPLPN